MKDLCFVRDDKIILNQVNYRFPTSGLAIVLGESGSGKSTLLKPRKLFKIQARPQRSGHLKPLNSIFQYRFIKVVFNMQVFI